MWYFVKKKVLKRKSKSKLNEKEIESRFLKTIPESGIVAYHVKQIRNSEGRHKYEYEYFGVEEFSRKIINISLF